jgi:hypothetical protein
MEGWKGGRVEGWKGGRVEGWKGGRAVTRDHRALRASFSMLPGKRKGGQVKSRRLILNSVFCFLTSVLAVRIDFEFEFEGD